MTINSLAQVITAAQEAEVVARDVVAACQEVKAKDVVVLDVRGITDVAKYFIIASARSDRQAQGIGNRVIADLAQRGEDPCSIEGFDTGHWILLDYGEVVVHVFYEPVRAHYDLEGLWAQAPKAEMGMGA